MTKEAGGVPALLCLDGVRQARQQLEYAELCAIESARDQGFTWADIGDSLGLTPQACQQRYARLCKQH